MKYPKINELVPKDEHFDESAINEAIYLTAAHVEAIENALATQANENASALTSIQTQLNEANNAKQTAETNLETANAEIGKKDETIAALQAEVEELKKAPADDFEQKGKEKDEQEKGKQPFHASDENPANKLADSLFGKPKEKPQA